MRLQDSILSQRIEGPNGLQTVAQAIADMQASGIPQKYIDRWLQGFERGTAMATNYIRCEPCLGMGYKGRWRNTARGKAWKLEACRACGGRGEREPRKRKAVRRG